MATATLQSAVLSRSGNKQYTAVSKSITHNNGRLYFENGRTYEAIGTDASGNRIYRDTSDR